MGSFCKHWRPPCKTDSEHGQAINESCFMGVFFGYCFPSSRPWDEYIVSKVFSPIVEMMQNFKGSLLRYHGVSCDAWNTWQSYWAEVRTAEFVDEICLPSPPCLGLLSIPRKREREYQKEGRGLGVELLNYLCSSLSPSTQGKAQGHVPPRNSSLPDSRVSPT